MNAELKYEQLGFSEEENYVKVSFLKSYCFRIPKNELRKIADFEIGKNSIMFRNASRESVQRKFNFLVEKYFSELTNILTGKRSVYVHKNSGIPLIGNTAFGVVYRNTNVIEVKPVTGCNLNCVYCSIDEGTGSGKKTDFLIEKDYLVQEIKKIADFIGEEWNCHIGTHGEPLLYPELKELISEISKIKNIRAVSMDTNAVLLSEEKADELIEAGLIRFNVSLDSLDGNLAGKMAGCSYNISHVKKIIEYIGKKSDILIAPVWVKGWNDSQMDKLVEFAMKYCRGKVKLGIQNFLEYDKGRKPAKQMPWPEFYSGLKKLEEKYKTKLILKAEDFGIHRAKSLPKPFGKGDVVKATVMCEGMYGSEKIAAAEGRSINVFGCDAKIGSQIRVKILRDKHNCFAGKQI